MQSAQALGSMRARYGRKGEATASNIKIKYISVPKGFVFVLDFEQLLQSTEKKIAWLHSFQPNEPTRNCL